MDSSFNTQSLEFRNLVNSGNNEKAIEKLNQLKNVMIDMDTLPPLCLNSPHADEERNIARSIIEYSVILSVSIGDKDLFTRQMACLRPYYTDSLSNGQDVNMMCTILGLNLLYLLVENRLSDFHCELELLSDEVRFHPAITFCTQLDQHLVIGSYDQVLVAAANPPVAYYSFFLTSLLETVRINIGECVSSAFNTLTLDAARKILMFDNLEETKQFISDYYPSWVVDNVNVRPLAASDDEEKNNIVKAREISSMKLITQSLTYATELERIV